MFSALLETMGALGIIFSITEKIAAILAMYKKT